MDCPFRKKTIYLSGRASGNGYPMEVEANETFSPCIGKTCAAFNDGECLLISNLSITKISEDFIKKLP